MATDPTMFDWAANVGVPVLLGAGTLALSIASFRIAKSAHALTMDSTAREAARIARTEEAERRGVRKDIAKQLIAWALTFFGPDLPGDERLGELVSAEDLVQIELAVVDEPGADALGTFIDELASHRPWLTTLDAKSYAGAAGALVSLAKEAVRLWVKDPAALDARLPDLRERLGKVPGELATRLQRADELAANDWLQ